jgi:hypothetical protein
MTFKKKMLDSKIFITSYTERGIVIGEEIRVGNFSVSNSASKITVLSWRFDKDRDGDTSRDGLIS